MENVEGSHDVETSGRGRCGHQRHMEHRFDDPERYAQSFDDPGRDEWQLPTRVIEALDIQPGQRVADLGAGTGYFTMRLTESTDADRVYWPSISSPQWLTGSVSVPRVRDMTTSSPLWQVMIGQISRSLSIS